jgi:hypothetical protein
MLCTLIHYRHFDRKRDREGDAIEIKREKMRVKCVLENTSVQTLYTFIKIVTLHHDSYKLIIINPKMQLLLV